MASRIVFDIGAMQVMALFSKITGSSVKDCIIENNHILFVVDEKEMSRAIGKQASHVRTLEYKLKKKVKVVSFSDNPCTFAANLMLPAQVRACNKEHDTVFLEAQDSRSRGVMIGRGAENLRRVEAILQRYFPGTGLRVK